MRAERKLSEFRDLLGSALRKPGRRIQPCANRSSADGEIVQAIERLLQALNVTLQQACPAAKLLPYGQGHGILQMRAPNFYDIIELLRLGSNRIVNAPTTHGTGRPPRPSG